MIGVYLQLGATTDEQYKALDAQIQAAGIKEEGCLLHTCFREGDHLAVFDIWESEEAFSAFAAQMGPLAEGAGVSGIQPQFVEMVAYEPR